MATVRPELDWSTSKTCGIPRPGAQFDTPCPVFDSDGRKSSVDYPWCVYVSDSAHIILNNISPDGVRGAARRNRANIERVIRTGSVPGRPFPSWAGAGGGWPRCGEGLGRGTDQGGAGPVDPSSCGHPPLHGAYAQPNLSPPKPVSTIDNAIQPKRAIIKICNSSSGIRESDYRSGDINTRVLWTVHN